MAIKDCGYLLSFLYMTFASSKHERDEQQFMFIDQHILSSDGLLLRNVHLLTK